MLVVARSREKGLRRFMGHPFWSISLIVLTPIWLRHPYECSAFWRGT